MALAMVKVLAVRGQPAHQPAVALVVHIKPVLVILLVSGETMDLVYVRLAEAVLINLALPERLDLILVLGIVTPAFVGVSVRIIVTLALALVVKQKPAIPVREVRTKLALVTDVSGVVGVA